jgi:hypothetical protein
MAAPTLFRGGRFRISLILTQIMTHEHHSTSELIIFFPHIIYSPTLQAYPNTNQPSKQTWLVICGEALEHYGRAYTRLVRFWLANKQPLNAQSFSADRTLCWLIDHRQVSQKTQSLVPVNQCYL